MESQTLSSLRKTDFYSVSESRELRGLIDAEEIGDL
jgi:hypothetical protein